MSKCSNSLNKQDVDHLSICLFSICISYSVKCLFSFFNLFSYCIICFFVKMQEFRMYFLKSFVRFMFSKYFILGQYLSFHFHKSVLWRANILNFYEVQFKNFFLLHFKLFVSFNKSFTTLKTTKNMSCFLM